MAKKTRSSSRSSSYRPAASYHAKDPEARERQLRNLKNRHKFKPTEAIKAQRWTQKQLEASNIIEFAVDCLGLSFNKRPAQEVVLRVLYGLPLTDEQYKILEQLTRPEIVYESGTEKTEGNFVVGARGGKSMLSSVIALYEATARAKHWKKFLLPGETGYAVITATRQKQSETIIQANAFRLLEGSKIAHMIDKPLAAELQLTNGLCIASFPCNSTAARGLPIFLLIFDEIAHYRVEGPKADSLIYNALRPRMAQFPGAKCLKISTPSAKQGLLWDEFSDGFDVPDRLTIQAETRLINPEIPQAFIDKEYKRDPDNALREFGAKFAESVSGFFESCIDKLNDAFSGGTEDTPSNRQFGTDYVAAIDQSGLAGRDRFAFSIAHKDTDERIPVDVTRTCETKDLDLILAEIEQLCAQYGITTVLADQYALGFVANAFEKRNITIEKRATLASLYVDFKTLILAGRVELPVNDALKQGLTRTEVFYNKSNSLSVAHPRDRYGHGDIADAVVTAVCQASKQTVYIPIRQDPYEARNERIKRDSYDLMVD